MLQHRAIAVTLLSAVLSKQYNALAVVAVEVRLTWQLQLPMFWQGEFGGDNGQLYVLAHSVSRSWSLLIGLLLSTTVGIVVSGSNS